MLGEQIIDVLAGLGLVGGEDVIEAAIFTDDDDDVLDGSFGIVGLVVIRGSSVGDRAAERKLQGGQHGNTDSRGMREFFPDMFRGHIFSLGDDDLPGE